MKFIALNHLVACPVCDTPLTLVSEQDKRVAHMRHEGQVKCVFYWKDYRVDRLTGDAEELYAQKSSEVSLQTSSLTP